MSAEVFIKLFIGALATSIVALVLLYVLSALISSPIALQPGATLYSEQQTLIDSVGTALTLLAGGTIAIVFIYIAMLRNTA